MKYRIVNEKTGEELGMRFTESREVFVEGNAQHLLGRSLVDDPELGPVRIEVEKDGSWEPTGIVITE